jgi:hypothetical protein
VERGEYGPQDDPEAAVRQRVDAAKMISQKTSENLLENLRRGLGESAQDSFNVNAMICEFEEEMERMRQLHDAEIKVLERKLEDYEKQTSPAGSGHNSDGVSDQEVESSAKKANRKSFERLDKVVNSQFGAIEKLREELLEERAAHQDSIEKLGEEASQQIAKVQAELTQARQEIVRLKQLAGASSSFSSRESFGKSPRLPNLLGRKAAKSRSYSTSSLKMGKHSSAPSTDEAWAALQQAAEINHGRSGSCDASIGGGDFDITDENSFKMANMPPTNRTSIASGSFKSTEGSGSSKKGLMSRLVGSIRR